MNETIEKRLHHLEDFWVKLSKLHQIIGLQNLNQSGNVVSNEPVASSGFYVDLLKSRISELEKQYTFPEIDCLISRDTWKRGPY